MVKGNLNKIFKSQVFKNSSWSIIEVGVYPILMLLATPIFIKQLGPNQYGIWMLINSFIASIGIFNLGLGDAAIKYISKYRGLKDLNGVKRVTNSTLTTYCILSFFIIIIGIGVILLLNFLNIQFLGSQVSKSDREFVSNLLIIGFVVFGLKLIELSFLSIFKGFERYDLYSKVSIISKAIIILLNVSLVLSGLGLIAIFLWLILLQILIILIEYFLIRKFYSDFSFSFFFDFETLKETLSFGLWSWTQGIISIMGGQMDKFIVTYLAGLSTLAYYSLAYTMASQIYSLFTAASSWVFPYVSNKIEQNLDIKKIFERVQFCIIVTGFLLMTGVYIGKNLILQIWLGNETANLVNPYLEGFILVNIFNLLSIVPHFVLIGANHIKVLTYNMIIGISATFLFMLLSYNYLGNIGLVYGKVIASIIIVPFFIAYVYLVIFKKNFIQTIQIIILPFLFAGGLQQNNSFSLILFGLAGIIIFHLFKQLGIKII